MTNALKKVSADIIRCYRCGDCREKWRYFTGTYGVCPVREELRHEHFCGRGRTAIARAILEKQLSYDKDLVDLVYNDLCCWNCREACSLLKGYRITVSLITRAMREDMVDLGLAPPEPIKKVGSNIEKTSNRFGVTKIKRNDWAKNLDMPEKAESVYFVGCYASYVYPQDAQSIVNILKKAEVDFTLLRDEKCCGVTPLWSGQTKLAKNLAKHNVNAIQKSETLRVIVSCAEGYHTIKYEYPKLIGKKLGFEVVHISQLLLSLLSKGKLKFKSKKKKQHRKRKVTYHDPCALGRGCGIYDSPRNIIKDIPSVKLIEMLRNHENAWCCGSGAGQVVRLSSPNLSKNIVATRLEEAEKTGADTLVTTCPFCVSMFETVKRANELNIKIESLTNFIVDYLDL